MPFVDCPHAARCAGCPLIELPLDDQLAHKRELVRRALERFGLGDALPVAPPRRAHPAVGYRTRAKLVAAPGPRLGLYARGEDHEVVDIPGCRVLPPSLAAVAAAIRRLMADPPAGAERVLEPAGGRRGLLRGVDLREVVAPDGTLSALVTLIVTGEPSRSSQSARHRTRPGRALRERHAASRATDAAPSALALRAAAAAIRELAPAVKTVAVSWHRGSSPQLLGSAPEVLVGPDYVRDQLPIAGGLFIHAAPGSFAQVHRAQAAAIYERAASWLEQALGGLEGAPIVEAYAGAGGLSLLLASRGAAVTLVESFAPAAHAAARAAEEQQLDVQIRVGDAGAELARLAAERVRPVAVVVNPTRSGLPASLRAACAALLPRAVVYISCDPETLGRDLADLLRLGWQAEALEPYDMIPLTDQVETLALLRRCEPPVPRLLGHIEGLVVVDKPGHEPVVPSPRGVSLVDRVRRAPGCAAAVAVHGLDAGASGLCLLAGSARDAQRWAERLRESGLEQHYLLLCRGICRPKGIVRRDSPARRRTATVPAAGGAPAERAARAVTRYRRIGVVGGHSLLLASSDGPRTESLRRHMASIGHPVLGDDRFGHEPSNRHLAQGGALDRPFVHRCRIRLPAHHAEGAVEWQAPLPGDLALVLRRLGGGGPGGDEAEALIARLQQVPLERDDRSTEQG